jgi:hypothetical protein
VLVNDDQEPRQPAPSAREAIDAASSIVARLTLRIAELRSDGPTSFGTIISDLEQVVSEIRCHLDELDNG